MIARVGLGPTGTVIGESVDAPHLRPLSRRGEADTRVVLVSGPRQAGKTTLVVGATVRIGGAPLSDLDDASTEDEDSLISENCYKLSGAFPIQLRPGRADASSMTSARAILVPPGSPGTDHCVSRCVRRALLCGMDRETGRSFEHRRQWAEDRIHGFGMSIASS